MSQSPTLSLAATQAGLVLGTAGYMSPEQAKGRPVDRRADIWAFGVVLYEMLAGRPIFSGETVSETLAQVMMKEPDWQALSKAPAGLVHLLRRCLVKDPRDRLQAIGDARIELDEISRTSSEHRPSSPRRSEHSRVLAWSLASLLVCSAAGAAAFVWWPREATAPSPISRWTIQLREGESIDAGRLPGGLGIGRPSIALSPDDRYIVYVVERDHQTMLHVRATNEFVGKPIPGTEGGFQPFFSPDGQWVGFFTDTKLKKVFLQGGSPVPLCDAVHVYGASWGSDDRIYFADREGNRLTRIAASGGTPEVVANSSEIGTTLLWPHILPGSRAALFNSPFPGTINVLSLEDRSRRPLIGGTSAAYVASGHIVFSRGSDVLTAAFDLERLAITGPAVPVLEKVRTEAMDSGQISISNRGTLAYVEGGFARYANLAWLDRQGRETPVDVPAQVYGSFTLSPDGSRIAVIIPAQTEGQTNDIWIYDLERHNRTRLATRVQTNPVWAPDGRSVFLGLEQGGPSNVYRLAADGTGVAERLTESRYAQLPQTISPDGKTLIFGEATATGDRDFWSLRLDGKEKPQPYLQTPAREIFAAFSPDGRWLAYVNDAAGRYEVYVVAADGKGDRRLVSTEGGEEPRWSARGDLFYRNGQQWMAVAVTPGASGTAFSASRPQTLFEGPFPNVPGYSYDVTSDGRRFLMAREAVTGRSREIRIVLNWFDELKQRVRAAGQ
jgi:serine/threonine-protein kinase